MSASATVTIQPSGSIQKDARYMATVTVSDPAVAQIETVTTVADSSGSLNSTWFHLYSAHDATHYYVWYNVNSAGVDPAVSGATGVEVDLATGATAAQVATATALAIDALAAFVSTALSAVVTVTNASTGLSTTPSNGTASPGFSYSILTPGQDVGTISLGTAQPQVFITSSPPQNPPVEFSSIDVYKGNLLAASGVGVYNFDGVMHSPGIYTVSAIIYNSSGISIPVSGASLTVLPVS